MSISIKHKFQSLKGDGSDATVLRPSNWNDEHNIQMATSKLLGRLTPGTGDAEELPVTSYMMGLLNTADIATLSALLGLPTTGDAVLTFKTVAASGWVLMNDGSIGDQFSNATTRANADCLALFTLFYNNVTDTSAPIQTISGTGTTRGAQGPAASAWAAHCRVVLPKQLGRAIIVGGAGAGLTNRALGGIGGAETHTITTTEIPDHSHTVSVSGSATGSATGTASGSATGTASGSASGSGSGTGSGTASGTGTASGNYSGTTSGHNTDHAHYTSGTSSGTNTDHSHTYSGTTASMNRSNPHSHGINQTRLIAQNFAGAGVGGGGAFAPLANVTDAFTINNADINHEHTFSGTSSGHNVDHSHTWGNWSGGVNTDHSHTFSGTVNSNVSFSNAAVAVSSIAVSISIPSISLSVSVPSISLSVSVPSHNLAVTGSGSTNGAGYASGPHNNMQPFTAWNVMVKL